MTRLGANGSPRLRVAIDGTPLLGQRTGIGHVTANLVDHLAHRDDVEVVVYAISRTGRRDLRRVLPGGARPGTSALPARVVFPLWERIDRPRIEHWTGRVDLVHATNYVAPPSRAPALVTVHDLTFVHHPELVSEDTRRFYGSLVREALDRGAIVHVVSDFVGAEVRSHFGLPAERVVRVYPGIAQTGGGDPSEGRRRAGHDRYVLALGQLEPRKNLPTLVRAFDAVADRASDLALVVAGPDGWDRPAFEAAVRASKHADRVRWLGYVGDRERRDLLAGACLFAYPSLYEGFGHPPLEAMLAGVPVVAAAAGAIPEIVADAALLGDPRDPSELAEALWTAIADEDTRARLITAGRRRAAEFDWERAATDFVATYRRIARR